ncbi:MAG: PAS domain-containing protein [Firmicutes bacterium]|nr:PAS domain-containing protein [Bacillota bacterium]
MEQFYFDMETILEFSYDGIVITDENGIILVANQAHERLTGLPRDEVVGSNIRYWAKKGGYSKSIVDLVLENKGTSSILETRLFDRQLCRLHSWTGVWPVQNGSVLPGPWYARFPPAGGLTLSHP